MSWGDYDNDGRPDLMMTGSAGKDSSGRVSILYHNTDIGFVDRSDLLPNLLGLNQSSVNWVDYDVDGFLDLLLTGYCLEEGAGHATLS